MPSTADEKPFNKVLHLISRSASSITSNLTYAKLVNLNVELNRYPLQTAENRVFCSTSFSNLAALKWTTEVNRMTLESMIESLSRQDQLVAMELLWRQITAGSEPTSPPEWHREILQERAKRIETGEADLLDWEEVKALVPRPAG